MTVLGPIILTGTEVVLLEQVHRRCGEPAAAGRRPLADAPGVDSPEVAEARRSLIARGLLDGWGRLADDPVLGPVTATLLDVRAGAARVITVERMLATDMPGAPPAAGVRSALDGSVADGSALDSHAATALRLVHLIPEGACVEDLLPDGSHHLYLLLGLADVVPAVTAVTVPGDAVAGARRVQVPLPRLDELAAALGRPTALVELTVLDPGAPASQPGHLLALGPTGCWVSEVDRGAPLPDPLCFEPVDSSWVEERMRDVLVEVADLVDGSDAAGEADGPEEDAPQGRMSG